jgi:hypothetical protein
MTIALRQPLGAIRVGERFGVQTRTFAHPVTISKHRPARAQRSAKQHSWDMRPGE